jgi:preprotein translocase subunit YajC
MGNMTLAAALATAAKSSSSSAYLLIIIVAVFIFYFALIRPQSRRRRQVMDQQRQAQPGQRVRTTSGMYATVVAIEDNDVILEVAEGIELRFLRAAIVEVLPGGDEEQAGFDGEPFTETEDEAEEAPDAETDADADDDASTVDAPAGEDESTEPADSEDVPEESRTPGSV